MCNLALNGRLGFLPWYGLADMSYCCIMPFLPAIGDSVIADTPNVVPKEYNKTVFTSEVSHGAADELLNGAIESYSVPKDPSSLDMVSPAKGTDVEAPSLSDNAQGFIDAGYQ